MNKIFLSFLLTLISGFSTLIGTILIFLKIKDNKKILIASLSFASAVMMCVCVTDLLPEGMKYISNYYNGILLIIIALISIIVGVIISMIIDKKFNHEINDNLYKVGIISMIGIILHNIPEGIATFLSSSTNISLGISLTIAIAMHNIPEGISISIPIYYATKNKKKAFLYTFISALSEPFGAFLAYIFLYRYINDFIMGILLFIITGIMMHIAIIELLPSSLNYKNKKITLIFFVIGILFMLIKFLF